MNNIDIEKKVLGSLLITPNILSSLQNKFSSELFENLNHRKVAQVINQLWLHQQNIEMLTVELELGKMGVKNAGAILMDLISHSTINYEYYLMILVERQIKKDFQNKFTILLKTAQSPTQDVFELRDKALDAFNTLFIDKFIDRNKENKSFPYLVDKVQERFTEITNGNPMGIFSSLQIINKAFGGWQNSDLCIVAARPGMGKTAFLVQQAVDVVLQDKAVGIFSLEMSAEQITGRIITNYTGIPNSSLLRKGLKDEEIERYFALKDNLIQLKIHIDDTPGISIEDLRIKAKMMKMRYGIDILFIDYLQLITQNKSNNREQEISAISRGLKALAKELNIPVIALSQLSRYVEQRTCKRPLLSDLRDSGAIEQDADEVMFLYRPEYYGIDYWGEEYNNESTHNETEIIIQKNRHGGILSERCKVNLATSQFVDVNN